MTSPRHAAVAARHRPGGHTVSVGIGPGYEPSSRTLVTGPGHRAGGVVFFAAGRGLAVVVFAFSAVVLASGFGADLASSVFCATFSAPAFLAPLASALTSDFFLAILSTTLWPRSARSS